LEPGQIVVIDGADRLKDGAKVRVTHNAPAASAQPQGEGAVAATPAAAQPSVAQPSAAAPSPAPAAAPPGAPANPPQRPDGQRRRSPE
jgi:multidrug efflux system membrane fusion protein